MTQLSCEHKDENGKDIEIPFRIKLGLGKNRLNLCPTCANLVISGLNSCMADFVALGSPVTAGSVRR
jgi:hypothetical protein